MEEDRGIDRRPTGDGLRQVGERDQDEQDERDGGQERVEGQRARQKRDVVFVGGLQGAAEKAGGSAMPPAGPNPFQASGSS
jgi:hypothetical protein